MATTSVSNIVSFVSTLETTLKGLVPGFTGFGKTLSDDIGGATVVAEDVFNGVLASFTSAGNKEASIIAPIASAIEGLVNGAEAAFGINSPSKVATTPASPVVPATGGDDGFGDSDSDTGAV